MPNPPPGAPTDRPRVPPPITALSNACVVLVRTQGPINLGMVARLCGNFGVSDLRVVAPECEVNCADSRKFSTHSKELLLHAPIFSDLAEATADCGIVIGTSGDFRDSELDRRLRAEEVPRYLAERPTAKWALVFGNEADGLNAEELRVCHAYIHLDTFGPNISYNLANAVAISAYVIASAGAVADSTHPPAARREHVAGLYRYWLETLERFAYFRRTNRRRFEPLFERFVTRLHLSEHDVQVLRGMLSHFNISAFKDRFDRQDNSSDNHADADVDVDVDAAERDADPLIPFNDIKKMDGLKNVTHQKDNNNNDSGDPDQGRR